MSAHLPFSFPAVVRSHGWVMLPPFEQDEPTGPLRYVGRLQSGRVLEMVIQGLDGGVDVAVDDDLSAVEREEVARQVRWMLGLDQDLSPFYTLVREEPKLAQVEERAQGRLLRSPTLFEDTVKTILTTNTAWSGTIRMVKGLVAEFGAPLPALERVNC